MRGRRPAGPEYVQRLPGSPAAKERARIILQTIAGELRLAEACALLGVCPQRFHQLREEALTGLVAHLEPGLPGRPAQTPSPEQDQVAVLEAQLGALDLEMRLARAREEIALTLPRVVAEPDPEKKTKPRPTKRRRGRPPGKKKNT
jgi:hypothetical protein